MRFSPQRLRIFSPLAAAVLLIFCAACSDDPAPLPVAPQAPVAAPRPTPAPTPAPSPVPPEAPPILLPDPEPGPNAVQATMRVVDLNGMPVAGMAPIATVEANAFQQPVATGPLTGPDGLTRFAFPGDQHLFLRAWDPKMKFFANNFYEALPDEGTLDEVLDIVMVEGARLEVLLYGPDSQPLVKQSVSMMMIHPSQGPWWPSRAQTDELGLAVFSNLPAGEFTIDWHVEPGLHTELPGVALRPGGVKDLGKLLLQQEAAS